MKSQLLWVLAGVVALCLGLAIGRYALAPSGYHDDLQKAAFTAEDVVDRAVVADTDSETIARIAR